MSYSCQEEYRRKLISADEAAGLVKPGMRIDYGAVAGFPLLVDEKLGENVAGLDNIRLYGYHSSREPQAVRADAGRGHIKYYSGYFSRFDRQLHEAGRCTYLPSQLGEMPPLYRGQWKGKIDIAFVEVAPPDERGFFNFGAGVSFQKALCNAARTVVVEVNGLQPFVYGGYDEALHISEVDFIVENDKYEIDEVLTPPVSDSDRRIAENITGLVEDGCVLELGIGTIPNLVGELLIKQGRRDLGIHSGTITDSMVDLIDSGVANGSRKKIDAGKAVACMALGSRKLYKYIHRNPKIALYPSEYSHSPEIIARNEKMVGVNSALKMDLLGQAASEALGFRQISGTSGQLAFNRGASMSVGGKPIICLAAARRDRNGKLVSNIVPALGPGDTVTTPSVEVCYVVTESGIVCLKGKDTGERARLLISIAHPDLRAELEEAARRAKIVN